MSMKPHPLCTRRWSFLLSLFLLHLLSNVSAEEEEKAPPEKGEGCANLASGDLNFFVNPCDRLIAQEIPTNAFDITMYAALPPFISGLCTYLVFRLQLTQCFTTIVPLVAFFVVNTLNVAFPQYDITIPRGDAGIFGIFQDFLPSNPNVPDVVAKVTLKNAGVGTIQRTPRSWWWEYRYIFECEYGTALPNRNEGDPITNILLKQSIQDDMVREIQTMGYVLQSFAIYENSRRIVGFALEDPRVTDPPFFFAKPERLDGGVRVPQPPQLPPSITPTAWENWRQAIGVILWIVIAVVGVTVTHLAGIRHRQRYKMNLTSPEGVEALLDVQWKRDRDDTYHIYHRTKQPERPPTIDEEEEEMFDEEQLLMGESTSSVFA